MLNPNTYDGAPSELYEDYMKRILRLPQVNEAFLVFLCKLKPDDLMSFWVVSEAFRVLEEK
jgi:hypothetical protein